MSWTMTTDERRGRYDGYEVAILYNWPDKPTLTVEYREGPERGRRVIAPQHQVRFSEHGV